jgi:ABC-type molybdate transport system substrate-binding protein
MRTIELRPDQPLDLDLTLSCGQAFRWENVDGWWRGVVDGRAVRIRQDADRLTFEGADAAFVYKSDVSKDDLTKVTRIGIPAEYNVVATYPLGVLAESPSKAEAESFIAFVRGPDGSAVLTDYGFDPIPAGN